MSRLFALLMGAVFVLGLPQAGSAQVSNILLGQAKSRLACGAGVVISAVLLPNGSLQVTCARPPAESATTSATTAATVAETTGLVGPAGLGTVISVTIVVGLTGGGDSGTTTTSDTDGGGGEGGDQ